MNADNRAAFPLPIHLSLGALITRLEAEDSDKLVALGFDSPHSYRGYYEDLAFVAVPNAYVGNMLVAARWANGRTFGGWKGGDFTMSEYTSCWLVEEAGTTGESLGAVLLEFMLRTPGEAPSPVPDGERI